MAESNEPFIRLEPGGKAPILSYNVPEPTSYSGQNLIEMEHPREFFTQKAFERPAPSDRAPVADLDKPAVISAVTSAMRTGFADRRLFPNVRLPKGGLRFVPSPNPGLKISSTLPVGSKLAELDPEEVAAQFQAGMRLNIYRSMYGTLTYNYVPEPTVPEPHLYLVETYRMSSFLGSYGAGRIVKTFSLLPGEKTTISIKTYQRTEQQRKESSSILDSFTEESAEDFESSMQQEQSDKRNHAKTFEYHAEAEASASWGFGSAKVSGGVKGGTNSAREEFAKNVSSAVAKHSAKASAKRDIQVDTSFEVKEETGEETAIQRTVDNINLSRTLNFAFRQMNQEFVTILHLVDVRVAFFNGFAESRHEVSVADLDRLLADFIVPEKHAEVRSDVISQLEAVLDYQDQRHSLVEERTLSDNDKYLRVRRDLVSVYQDALTGSEIPVPGLILAANKSVLRTEGIIVEALLGEGEALDTYAGRLQELEVARREAAVRRETAEASRVELVNQVARDGDAERTKLLVDLLCPCDPRKDDAT